MSAAVVQTNGSATYNDWPGRYFHVDQVLDRPGPRTDPSFLAGDGVGIYLTRIDKMLELLLLGQKILAQRVQDPCDWRWWLRLRDFVESRVIGIQRYPCY